MSHIRGFSSSDEFQLPPRAIDSDAPDGLRQEFVDLIFHIVEHNPYSLEEQRIHRIVCQSLGVRASGQPYAGFRYAAGRDLAKADWRRTYDLIIRLWSEFHNAGLANEYHEGVNRILSSYGVVWELDAQGQLRRFLPPAAQAAVTSAIAELQSSRFRAALALFDAARDAFDDRPRRDRDVCSNIFDAMESVAKEVFQMPTSTFGSVLTQVRQRQSLLGEVISILEAINTLRNRKFGHGMTTPFDLDPREVDFTYLTCIGAIIMFARI